MDKIVEKYSLGIYEKAFPEDTDWIDMFNIAKNAGYNYFEISIDRTDKRINRLYNKNVQKKIKLAIKDSNFPIISMCLSTFSRYSIGTLNENEQKKVLDIFNHAIMFSKYIGIKIIQIPGYDVIPGKNSTKSTKDNYLKMMNIFSNIASKNNIILGIENMDTEFCDTISKSVNIVKKINSPFLKLYPDSGNIINASNIYNYNFKNDIKKADGNIVAFHIKEVRENKYGGLFYGEGIVPFKEILNEIKKQNVKMFVMEYWFTGNVEWIDDLYIARDLFYKWIS